VLIDLTDSTAEAEDVAEGKVFYNKAGVRTLGTGTGGSSDVFVVTYNTTPYADILAAIQADKDIILKPATGSNIYYPTRIDYSLTDNWIKFYFYAGTVNGTSAPITFMQWRVAYGETWLNAEIATYAKAGVDALLEGKQDSLVSGTNIKTINGTSLLGSGDIDIAFTAIYGTTTYADLVAALNGEQAVIVKDIPYNGDSITVLVNSWIDNGSSVEIDSIATAQGDLCDVDITVTNTDAWSSAFVNRDPFTLYDFQQTLSNVEIPYCTENIANTSIPNVDISISNEMGVNWAIASLAKYEVTDSSGKRINCWPVCQFSMNTQKTLRLRMMCAGTSRQTAVRIAGAILLKHR